MCSLTLVTCPSLHVKHWYRGICAVCGENNNSCYVLNLLLGVRNFKSGFRVCNCMGNEV